MILWPNGGVTVPPYPGQAKTGFRASSEFGWRTHPVTGKPSTMHYGIDLVGWSTIVAPVSGVVSFAGYNGGAGNEVRIKGDDGNVYRLLHNRELWVRKDQRVTQGQGVAIMGTTGSSTGIHCHFEIHPNGGIAVNPRDFMAAANREDDPFMGLAQWQQDAIFNALYDTTGHWYKTDAIINVLRGEVEPRLDGIAAGGITFPGAPYYAFQAIANQNTAIMQAIQALDPNADAVDFEAILRESEARTVESFGEQFQAFSAVMRAELVVALADAQGLTGDQIVEAVNEAFARAFAPVISNLTAAPEPEPSA